MKGTHVKITPRNKNVPHAASLLTELVPSRNNLSVFSRATNNLAIDEIPIGMCDSPCSTAVMELDLCQLAFTAHRTVSYPGMIAEGVERYSSEVTNRSTRAVTAGTVE